MKAKIRCNKCNSTFEVKETEINENESIKCPKCSTKMDGQSLDRLKQAFETIAKYQSNIKSKSKIAGVK